MSDMVDRALRAWLVNSHDYDGTVCLFEELRPDELAQGRDCMRAALAALREPTAEMFDAACALRLAISGNERGVIYAAWHTMIDEAVK